MGCSQSSSDVFNAFNWFIIIKNRDIESINIFIKNKFDINVRDSNDFYRKTALLYAILMEDFEIVKLLLENGANIECFNRYGDTALMYAVYIDNIEMVKLLLENGAKVNAKANNGATALVHTLDLDVDIEIAKLLYEKGADVNVKYNYISICCCYLDSLKKHPKMSLIIGDDVINSVKNYPLKN